jgi:hypothetical protein
MRQRRRVSLEERSRTSNRNRVGDGAQFELNVQPRAGVRMNLDDVADRPLESGHFDRHPVQSDDERGEHVVPVGIGPGLDGHPGVARGCDDDGADDRRSGVRDPARDHSLILLGGRRRDRQGQQPEADGDPRQRPTRRMTAWNAGSDAIVLNGGYWWNCPSSTAWSSNACCKAARAGAFSPSAS